MKAACVARKEKLGDILVPTINMNENIKWLFKRENVHSCNVSCMESQLEDVVGEKENIHKCSSSSKHTYDEKSVLEYTAFRVVRMTIGGGI